MYSTPESWASNIQKACNRLPTEISMSNFYSYLFNPSDYHYREQIQCITPQDVETFEKQAKAFDLNSAKCGMKMTTYTNLHDGKIFYESMNKLSNGKKCMDGLLESVSQKTQGIVPKGVHEKSIRRVQEEKIDITE